MGETLEATVFIRRSSPFAEATGDALLTLSASAGWLEDEHLGVPDEPNSPSRPREMPDLAPRPNRPPVHSFEVQLGQWGGTRLPQLER